MKSFLHVEYSILSPCLQLFIFLQLPNLSSLPLSVISVCAEKLLNWSKMCFNYGRGGLLNFWSISILLGCINSVHQFWAGFLLPLPAVWMLPDLALFPFICFLSLSLSSPPLKSTHRHNPLLRQQVKQNNSLCHTIAPLPRSRLWLLYSRTLSLSLLPSLSLPLSCSSISSSSSLVLLKKKNHTIVTLIQQEPPTVNCLTFLIVCWCCAVWSVSTLFSPTHQDRFVNVATFIWWELELLCSYIFVPVCWNLSTCDTALNRQEGFL